MRPSFLALLAIAAAMWAVEVANAFMGHRLNDYGILPRTTAGLIGIPLAPFLHAGFGHVLGNTIPLLALGSLVALQAKRAFAVATLFVVLVGGAGVWLVGRSDLHVGASGLVFGYFGFLVARGWFDRRFVPVLIALAVLVMYGGLLFGVLPTRGFVSWEGHLCGLLAGILAARSIGRGGDGK